MCMKYLYVRCNTRAFENNPRVIFKICQGTPEDTRVFVNLVESCTIPVKLKFLLIIEIVDITIGTASTDCRVTRKH